MFRPIDYNALDREFRPGKPLSTEIRRKTDSWFVFERRGTKGNLANSSCYLWRSVCVFFIIRHYQTYVTYFSLSRGGQRNPSKLSDNVLESIELFKLMKPSMFGREIRERLLNDGVCDGRNLPVLSTVNKGIKIKLRIINKLILDKTEVTSVAISHFHKYRTFHL